MSQRLASAWLPPLPPRRRFRRRASVAVNRRGGPLGHMLGNLEVLLREKLGITVRRTSAIRGFAGYGPGFWGPGHDPFTHQVLGPDEVDMSKVIGALGFHTERVSEPADIIPALRRAFDVNKFRSPGLYRVHLLPVPGLRPVGRTGGVKRICAPISPPSTFPGAPRAAGEPGTHMNTAGPLENGFRARPCGPPRNDSGGSLCLILSTNGCDTDKCRNRSPSPTR